MTTNDLSFSTDVFWYVAIVIVGFVVLVALSVRIRRVLRRMRFPGERGVIQKQWAEVETLMHRGDPTSRRLAVIQADMVLDLALKAKAFPGTTIGERLKFATRKYRDLRQTFWARTLRNKLVHEAGVELNVREAKSAIAEFRKALRTLGAI